MSAFHVNIFYGAGLENGFRVNGNGLEWDELRYYQGGL